MTSTVHIDANGHAVPFNLLVRLRGKTPPGSRLVDVQMIAPNRVKMGYRYHGLTRVNRIEVDL